MVVDERNVAPEIAAPSESVKRTKVSKCRTVEGCDARGLNQRDGHRRSRRFQGIPIGIGGNPSLSPTFDSGESCDSHGSRLARDARSIGRCPDRWAFPGPRARKC
jgi:hypothetical protein